MVKKSPAALPPSEKEAPARRIGDYCPVPDLFPSLDETFQEFHTSSFLNLSRRKQFKRINQVLLNLINGAPENSYLLGAISAFIGKVNDHKLLGAYNLASFEFWLNHFSELSAEDAYRVRGKIMGKLIPRDAYQSLFPIGGSTIYPGTHFVTAHLSPDIDTTIASFWGWCDAFAAKVGSGEHYWCLPGGPPPSPMTKIFTDLWGEPIFHAAARTALTLSLTAQDLVTQKNLAKEPAETLISTIDHGINEKAILLVDEQGHYLGDWRSSDVELVRQVTVLFKSCLHWFENNLHIKLVALFAAPQLHVDQVQEFIKAVSDVQIVHSEPVQEFSENQTSDLDLLLIKVLNMPKGIRGTFRDLSDAMAGFEVYELSLFLQELENLAYSSLFDVQGWLIDDRTGILNQIERIIIQLDIAIHCVRNYVERLDAAVQIKEKVTAKFPEPYLTLNNDVDEIRLKMKSFNHLTVLVQDDEENAFPVGVVWADDLRKSTLGTVSLRDFSSFDEVRMAPYLSVISVIDHHRSSINTPSTPLTIIGDVQSSNVLVAELAFEINDRYSTSGMSLEEIQAQLGELASDPTPSMMNLRLQRRLLKKLGVLKQAPQYYIHPKREFAEYLTIIYGICDDTDLLTKVTPRDVHCVAALLNRMKTLMEKRECEVISLDDIPHTSQFAKLAAKRILRCPDMYSIYKRIFGTKEEEVERQIKLCAEGKPNELFADTKEQNRCSRIGQIKLFSSNFAGFDKHRPALVADWLSDCKECVQNHPEIDLHLMMVSTIPTADEVYHDKLHESDHQDELWFWCPPTRQALAHLSSFLLAFQSAPEVLSNEMSLEAPNGGEFNREVLEIFQRHFLPVKIYHTAYENGERQSLAVLRYKAGTINSRKAMITPYLPKIIV